MTVTMTVAIKDITKTHNCTPGKYENFLTPGKYENFQLFLSFFFFFFFFFFTFFLVLLKT